MEKVRRIFSNEIFIFDRLPIHEKLKYRIWAESFHRFPLSDVWLTRYKEWI
jgi:hypothetical protein